MATQLQDNPEFLHFVNYMGVQLTASNLHIYSDLYGNFAGWPPPTTCNSFAEKFIQWKRFYDDYKETQQQILHTNLFNTQPRDPRVLKTTTVQLPHDLQQLNNQSTNFQHFILQNEPRTTVGCLCWLCSTEPPKDLSNDAQDLSIMDNNTLNEIAENVEILEVHEQSEIILHTPSPPQSTPQTPSSIEANPPTPLPRPQKSILQNPPTSPPTSPHRGKNIQQMKEIYHSEKKSGSKPPKPAPRKRKRKEDEPENEKVVTVGPGRPTKNDALLRDAKNEEESGHDDDSLYTIREVLLLSENGTIRKKTKLLTKQSDSDMKCFSIKHFASLDYIAEKKKKAFLIIKKQRQKQKTLNYLESNTLKDMKDINNM
jgi:hypothetical protein